MAWLVGMCTAHAIIRSYASTTVTYDDQLPAVAFAAREIGTALLARSSESGSTRRAGRPRSNKISFVLAVQGPEASRLVASLGIAPLPAGSAQSYSIRKTRSSTGETIYVVLGADPAGTMYGGLDLAEAIRMHTLSGLGDSDRVAAIARRGIKFNLPLDYRTPGYSDAGDSAQQNIPVMWSMNFWHQFLDAMARDRFNVLSLWNEHPFPSMVKVPEYPAVALDDVKRTTIPFDSSYNLTGSDIVRAAGLAHLETVRVMTIEQKIQFWRNVMQYAHDRGIEVYIVTWNIFTWGAEGKYGITSAQDNPVTIDYFRESVRQMLITYPLLAGFGISAGEHMHLPPDDLANITWLWSTYGEGIRDVKTLQPDRSIRLIFRFLQKSYQPITRVWSDYPDVLDFEYKYSSAHMYSEPQPPFAAKAIQTLPPDRRLWLTFRNDDIYSFRWGDPDYVRAYLKGLPGPEKLAGTLMGSDGYIGGRDFSSIDSAKPPQLLIDKDWLSFMLWGRLGYDPTLPDSLFRQALQTRYPDASSTDLLAASVHRQGLFRRLLDSSGGTSTFNGFPKPASVIRR